MYVHHPMSVSCVTSFPSSEPLLPMPITGAITPPVSCILLDVVFLVLSFWNEISWKDSFSPNSAWKSAARTYAHRCDHERWLAHKPCSQALEA